MKRTTALVSLLVQILALPSFLASAPSALAAQQGDWIQRIQKVSSTRGNFAGSLADGDVFGVDSDGLGDLDGDGVPDIVVGAQSKNDGGTDRGAVFVLFLNPIGTVKAHQKISQTAGGFGGALSNGDLFGHATSCLGDLDGDGVADLAVSAIFDDDGGTDRGAVWILFLNADGTVKAHQKISQTAGGFGGALSNGDRFGISLDSRGDVDGDGIADLAVGAHNDDDGGTDRGAVWILLLNTDGTVKDQRKISQTAGGFPGTLANVDHFGDGVTWIGDLDGDGTGDLAVGAHGADDTGSMSGSAWILFLEPDLTVREATRISGTTGGFTETLNANDLFGLVMGTVGDLDGDGRDELGVGAVLDDDGGRDRGAFWILFLDSDGTVRDQEKIGNRRGGFTGNLNNDDHFGRPRAIGDLNGDGITDLAVGVTGSDDGGTDRGAIFVLRMAACVGPQLAVRNGTAVNPEVLCATAGPRIGTDWTVTVDATGSAPDLAILVAHDLPIPGTAIPAGEVLVDTTSLLHFRLARPHAGGPVDFTVSVPTELSLCGLTSAMQAVVFGAPGPVLTNALDVVVGP